MLKKGDSGASQHYFNISAAPHLTNVQPDPHGPSVMLPDRSIIKATHKGHLPFPSVLSPTATSTALFPNLHNNLISIGQLCDDNCQVFFTKNSMKILKNNNEIIQVARSTTGDGLWNIPLPSPTPTINNVHNCSLPHPTINVIIKKNTTAKDLALYLHATCFSPTKDTFLKAIKNNHFIGWPGLNSNLITKHLTPTIASIKGHLKQEKQGLQ